jgi:hypothetical protein
MAYDPDVDEFFVKKVDFEEFVTRFRALEADVSTLGRELDDASVVIQQLRREVAALAVPQPVETTPSVSEWEPKFPGDTRPGMLRWGCTHGSNTVPAPHETAAKVAIGLRRTFWRLDQASSVVSTCTADHNAGRLPWVSIKLPVTWESAVNGAVDDKLVSLIKRLGALDLPVWFTVHHEPEGGNGTQYPDGGQGTEVHWRNLQYRIRQLITTCNVKNIAFAPILMAWTFDPRSNRNPADWWVDGIWDFAGIDHYIEIQHDTMLIDMWKRTESFYKEKGLKIAVAEWGNKDHGPSGAQEMQDWFDHLRSINALGACYFDTSLNGGVPLSGDVLVKFREIMNHPNALLVNEF